MTAEMTINLPLEKVRQHLVKYFETRDDVKVKSSKHNYIRVHTLGSKHPWINIKIGMFGEGNRTRLAVNFDFRMVYTIMSLAVVIGIAILWGVTLIRPENAGYAIGTMIGILIFAPVAFASSISSAKRKFLNGIREAFDLLKTVDPLN